ncbi:riboflavin transporter 2 [Scleropages formosus]|uniref:Riboflavin transporter n=2 Tax=Scleropages formosus TaxID=113540 RepID=A0A8C9RF07_SCLFO|nr:riboflavin transporter 2-like [Scleropages formosus]
MSLFTHVLACLFGTGSWVSINGMWVELPLIVPEIPEGWYLPSYLSVIIQMANIGPLFVTLMHRFRPGVLNEVAVIYFIISLGTLASFLLAFFWKVTLNVAGFPHSVPLLLLTFFLSLVDCTSSVTFLPFMMRLKPQYLTSYFIGEGLSGLIPAVVALIQGVGILHCSNHTVMANETLDNSTTMYKFEAQYLPANFSTHTFFLFLSTMMVVCLLAFLFLNLHPAVRQQHETDRHHGRMGEGEKGTLVLKQHRQPEEKPMISPFNGNNKKTCSFFRTGTYGWIEVLFIFSVLGWTNALTNTVLPSVQSYSCMPYGNNAYHWSVTMAAVANPLACLIAVFYPKRSLKLMGFLTLLGTGIGAYIMGMAVLSPCPLFIQNHTGAVFIVGAWFFFVLTLSYVKVIIGIILRDEGHSALVWCGAVVQLGSILGAFAMFPIVSVYRLFTSGDPCNTVCSK